jgi:hypothetical protein
MRPSLGFSRRSFVAEILTSLRGYVVATVKLWFQRLATPQRSGDLGH